MFFNPQKRPVISYCLQKKKEKKKIRILSWSFSRPSQVAGMTAEPPTDSRRVTGSEVGSALRPSPSTARALLVVTSVWSYSLRVDRPPPLLSPLHLPYHLECGLSQMGTRILCSQATVAEASCSDLT